MAENSPPKTLSFSPLFAAICHVSTRSVHCHCYAAIDSAADRIHLLQRETCASARRAGTHRAFLSRKNILALQSFHDKSLYFGQCLWPMPSFRVKSSNTVTEIHAAYPFLDSKTRHNRSMIKIVGLTWLAASVLRVPLSPREGISSRLIHPVCLQCRH